VFVAYALAKYVVFGTNPVIDDANDPIPDPSCVLEFKIVGLPAVFQHIPLAVTGAPPSAEILPPLTALVAVTEEAGFVLSVGKEAGNPNVEKETCWPYAVPAEFAAYALTKYVVFGAKPVIDDVNAPVPEPSCVLVFAIVGLTVVLQQIPRAVTGAPPSAVILPPLIALVVVIDEAGFVSIDDKDAGKAEVVNETS